MTFIKALLVLTVASLLNFTSAQAEDRAVVVGINDHPYSPKSKLNGARPDALRFYDFLLKHQGLRKDQITLLLDAKATPDAIIRNLVQDLKFRSKPGDRVIFYFAGHGMRIEDKNGDEVSDNLDEVLITADVLKPKSPWVIRDDDLRILFEAFPDRRILVVIDACHSGSITRSTLNSGEVGRAFPEILPDIEETLHPLVEEFASVSTARRTRSATLIPGQKHMDVWSAVAQDEVALETPRGGFFTNAFLEGMTTSKADLNGNGRVSNSELLRHVQRQSQRRCDRSKLCQTSNKGRLTPEFSGVIQRTALFAGRQPVQSASSSYTAPIITAPPKPQPVRPAPADPVQTPPSTASSDPTPSEPQETPLDDTPPTTVSNVTAPSKPTVGTTTSNTASGVAMTTDNPPPSGSPGSPGFLATGTPGLGGTQQQTASDISGPSSSDVSNSPPTTDVANVDPAQQVPNSAGGSSTSAPETGAPGGALAQTTPQDPSTGTLPTIDTASVPATDFEETDVVLNDTALLQDLFVPHSDALIQVQIGPSRLLRLNDVVSFDISAQAGGQIAIFDFNPEGELMQLFPSPLSPEGAERLGEDWTLRVPNVLSRNGQPLRIRVVEPTGKGHLIALLIEDESLDVAALIPNNASLTPVPDARRHLTALATALNKTTTDPNGARPLRWHAAVIDYEILP